MAYIFGGNTGISSPAEAKRLRDIADALAGQRRQPHTIGEGLSAIGDAIASRRSADRADRMESEGRAAFQEKYGDLFKNAFGGSGAAADPVPTAPGGVVPPQPDLSQAHPEYLTGGGMAPPPSMENVANTQLPPAEDLNAIVRTVIGEAGNQSPEGQRAVAEVILNRARETGMTPMQVVSAKGQFEPWATRGAELNAIDPNSPQYQSVLGNITSAFGPDDPTGGADHFYSPGAQAALGRDTPDWAQGQQGRDIGDHRFYSLGYGGDAGTSGAQDATAAQAAGQPGVQVADSGNGFDPRMIDALNDPWAPEGTKAVLEELFKQQLKQMEPLKPTADIQEFEYDKAHGFDGTFHQWIQEKKAKAAGPDEFGVTPIYGQDAEGNTVILQTSKSGRVNQPKLPPGFKLTPGTQKVDLGTKWAIYDTKSGTLIGVFDKDVAGEAAAKAGGTETGKAQVNLPGVEEAAGRAFGTIDDLLSDPALPNLSGAVESRLPTFREDTARAESKLKLLQGQVFLQAYNDLRGAGQISEQEGQAAKEAYSRLTATGVSDPDFVKALRDYRIELQKLVNVARQKAGQPPLPIDAGPAEASPNDPVGTEYDSIDAIPEGQYFEGPDGKTYQKKNGKQVPVP